MKKNKPKKILFIANILTHHQIFNSFLVKKLTENGHDVVVIASQDIKFEILGQNVKFINWNVSRAGLKLKDEYVSFFKLCEIIKTENPDIVHNFTIKANIYGTFASKIFSRARIINTVTGLGYVFTGTSLKSWLKRSIIKICWKLSLKISDFVLFMNKDDMRALGKGISDKKKNIVPGHGVDFGVFSKKKVNLSKTQTLISELGIKKNTILVVMIGRLIRQKGITEFWEAAKKLINEFSNVLFLVVGMTDLHNPSRITEYEISQMQNQKFIILFNRNDISEILSLSDIFVLPSYREGGPQVIIEAMAMGLPIVTTDVPGCRDRISNKNGFLVESKNSQALYEAIKKLIVREDLREAMGKNSYQMAREDYSRDYLTDKVIAAYKLD